MTVLFAPIGTHGFVYPLLDLARRMRADGHDPYFATHQQFEAVIDDAGETRVPRGEPDGPSFQIASWADPLNVALQVKHLRHAVETTKRPDVIVTTDLAHGPLIVGEQMDIPVAILGLCAYLWPQPAGSAPPTIASAVRDMRDYHLRERTRLYGEARRRLGLGPPAKQEGRPSFLGDLYMLRSSPDLEVFSDVLPDAVPFVGACLGGKDEAASDALARWLDDARASGDPVVYVQHAQHFHQADFWTALLKMSRERSVRVVAATGRMDAPLGDLPDTIYAEPHPPLHAVVPHADAVLASGTTTTVLGALSYGCPLLLLPAGGEHPIVAECCAEAGAAKVMNVHRLTAARLDAALTAVLRDPSYRASAQHIQRSLSRTGGEAQAAHLVETLAGASVSAGANG